MKSLVTKEKMRSNISSFYLCCIVTAVSDDDPVQLWRLLQKLEQISPNKFHQISFTKYISPNMFHQIYFTKYISPNKFHQIWPRRPLNPLNKSPRQQWGWTLTDLTKFHMTQILSQISNFTQYKAPSNRLQLFRCHNFFSHCHLSYCLRSMYHIMIS